MNADEPPVSISSVCFLPAVPAPSRCYELLPPEAGRAVRILANYLERGKCHGPELQQCIANWLNLKDNPPDDNPSEDHLASWLKDAPPNGTFSRRRFDLARASVNVAGPDAMRVLRLLPGARGSTATKPPDAREPMPTGPPCPAVLFESGPPAVEGPRVAFLNSRKPRAVNPEEPWLRALDLLLTTLASNGAALVGSFGTLSYDLASARMLEAGSPAAFVLPDGLGALPSWAGEPGDRSPSAEWTAISCAPTFNRCAKARRLPCRDRLVALLADIHVLLDVRAGGNLARALEPRQARAPSRLFVLAPGASNPLNSGGLELARRYPDRATLFRAPEPARPGPPRALGPACKRPVDDPPWSDHLYHYVRAFPSMPWPGESRKAYLSSLLRGDPESGHRALDTLLRILREGRIRASARLIQGDLPAVCWTPIPPHNLAAIRRWNQALIRWTFEPYGIAVSRRFLKAAGTRPVIYGGRETVDRLRPEDRYRHQFHEPGSASWKGEREWRLPGDFPLEALSEAEAFLFVPTEADAEELAGAGVSRFPIHVIPEGAPPHV